MRVMIRAMIDTEMGNKALKSGDLPKVVGQFMEMGKPEAAYFTLGGGRRCAYFIVDMQESSQMPPMLEGLFNILGAEIDITPVMNQDELRKGIAQLQASMPK